jgi:hypothetical protein
MKIVLAHPGMDPPGHPGPSQVGESTNETEVKRAF